MMMGESTITPFLVYFPRHRPFVGREDELSHLHHTLHPNNKVSIVGLTGMGGIGKTQLAVEYVYRYRDHYSDGIYWLNAARPLSQEFAQLAERLWQDGNDDPAQAYLVRLHHTLHQHFNLDELKVLCHELGIDYEDLPPNKDSFTLELVKYCQRRGRLKALEVKIYRQRPHLLTNGDGDNQQSVALSEQIETIFNYLRRRPHALLVLDNLPEPAILLESVSRDAIPADLPCMLLFTTRSHNLAGFEELALNVLSETAALELLLGAVDRQPARQPGHAEYETACTICNMLGRLPLAVEIAGKQLAHFPTTSLAKYQEELLNRGALPVLADSRAPINIRHETGLQAVLAGQWQSLQSNEARLLLRVAGQLPEAAVMPVARLGLLAGISEEGKSFFDVTLSVALRQLVDASLVELLAGDQVRLHPLVREFAQRQTPQAEWQAFRETCAGRLVHSFEQFELLEQHYRRRGIRALEQDLSTTIEYFPEMQPVVAKRLKSLLRLLQQESHNLDNQLTTDVKTFAQQISYRAWCQNELDLMDSALEQLTKMGCCFQPLWRSTKETPAFERALVGHTSAVEGVVITPDGRHVVSASDDYTLKIWNLKTGELEQTLTGHQAGVSAVAITTDGRYLISASTEGALKVWNLKRGEAEQTWTGHTERITSLATTADGRYIVSASDDRIVKIWDLRSGTLVHTLAGHHDKVYAVAVTADDNQVVSASVDTTVRIWNLKTGKLARVLAGHTGPVRGIVVVPHGQVVVSAASDGTVRLWRLKTGGATEIAPLRSRWLSAIAVTPDGRRLIVADEGARLRVWNLEKGVEEQILSGHSGDITSIAVTPDGKQAISTSLDSSLRVWNLEAQSQNKPSVSHTEWVKAIAITPDGRQAVSASYDFCLKIWNLATGELERTLTGHRAGIWVVRITPDGQYAVSASLDGDCRVWDLKLGHRGKEPRLPNSTVRSIAITPNGDQAVFSDHSHTLKVSNLWTGKEEAKLDSNKSWINDVAISPDGDRAVVPADNQALKVWNLKTKREEQVLQGHIGEVEAITITPDGRLAISASDDRTLKVWNLQTGRVERTLIGHTLWVYGVAVLDNQRVISASPDCKLKVWDLRNGKEIGSMVLDASVLCVAVSPNSDTLVVGDGAGCVSCFRVRGIDEA